MNNKTLIIGIIISLLIGLCGIFWISQYLSILNKGAIQSINESKSPMIVNLTIADISSSIHSNQEEIKPNTKHYFKLGQRFKYKIGREALTFTSTFYVRNIERINRTSCYMVVVNSTNMNWWFCIDKDNGNIVVARIGNNTVKEKAASSSIDIMCAIGRSFYAHWMLALDNTFRWKEEIYTTKPVIQRTILEYEVIGMENVDGRTCFKVEVRDTNNIEGEKKQYMKHILWIDAEKRILIRQQSYIQNLMVSETNLIEV